MRDLLVQKKRYAAHLRAMTDDALVKECEQTVWLSAYAANNPRSSYHWQVDGCHDEAKRRGKPWLYQRGWNAAYRIAGYEPTEREIAQAMEPTDA